VNHSTIEALYELKLEEERARGQVTWPSPKYAHDILGFCGEVLGFAPTAWQAACLTAIAEKDIIAVRSGRKLGKSRVQAAAALWAFTKDPDATVVFVAPTESQIQRIVYYDFLQLHGQSGRCLSCKLRNPGGPRPCPHSACIDGEPSPSCRSGLQVGARRVFGIAPRNADHMRGISGSHQTYLLDESPGIMAETKDACAGNIASTGRTIACFGNPSSRHGWFFDMHTKAGSAHRIAGSSLASPNVVLGRRVVEGLADTKWIASMREECSEDDPKWQVDVLGEFPTRDMLRVIDDLSLAACFRRWEQTPPSAHGALFFGIDAAGGTGGDTSVIATRRGWRLEPLHGFQGATDRIMMELAALLRLHRRGNERVEIHYDAAGRWGKDLGIALGQLRRSDENIHATGLESRGFIPRTSPLYSSGFSRPRDAFWGNAAQLMKTVVSIPYHDELREDFTFAEWTKDSFNRDKLQEKTEQRKATGRSPDYADAVCYCLWEGTIAPLSEITQQVAEERAALRAQPEEPGPPPGPYAWHESRDAWGDDILRRGDNANPSFGGGYGRHRGGRDEV
jgi:hypothetical protein